MMSFMTNLWRSSKLETLLETATEFTQEILDQDDVFEEARFMNDKLIKLLATKGAVKLLLEHMLDGPLPSSASLPNPNRYAAVSCEILNLGLAGVNEVLFSTPELLEQYFAFLKKPSPLPMPNALYFCKVGVMLLDRAKQQLATYVRDPQRSWVAERLGVHMSCGPVAELLLTVVKADQLEPVGLIRWLRDAALLPSLVTQLDNPDSNSVVCQFLLDLINMSSAPSLLVHQLDNDATVTKLLEPVLQVKPLATVLGASGLDVVNALLKWHTVNVLGNFQHYQEQRDGVKTNGPTDSAPADDKENDPRAAAAKAAVGADAVLPSGPAGEELTFETALSFVPVCRVLSRETAALVAALQRAPEKDMRELVPFGTLRLKLLQIVNSLLGTGPHNPAVYTDWLANEVPRVCLDLFFAFEWNNFVHHLVEDMLRQIFECSSEPLKAQLFGSTQLVQRITKAFAVPLESRGYFGHLSRICQNMIRCSAIQKYLEGEDWKTFTLERIQPLFKLESAQLGAMDLVELFPELKEEILAHARVQQQQQQQQARSRSSPEGGNDQDDEDDEEDPVVNNCTSVLENEEGDEYPPPAEPQWVY